MVLAMIIYSATILCQIHELLFLKQEGRGRAGRCYVEMEFGVGHVQSFASIVNDIFRPTASKRYPTSQLDDLLDEKHRSSLLVSLIVLLIVVVIHGERDNRREGTAYIFICFASLS